VLPCLHKAETLAKCIEDAQAALDKSGIAGEIIVADNGPTDRSIETAMEHNVRLIRVAPRGYGAVVRHADVAALPPGGLVEVHGAHHVAAETLTNTGLAQFAQLALVNGNVGLIVAFRHRLHLAFTLHIENDLITEIDVIANSDRLARRK